MKMMETTMYPDAARPNQPHGLKRPGSLDINTVDQVKSKASRLAGNNLLDSPALDMLKLASPELERMIIAHGVMSTTPTPTKFVAPNAVTEDQELYARGFMDALEKIHQQSGQMDTVALSSGGSCDYQTSTAAPTFTTLTTLAGPSQQPPVQTYVTENPSHPVLVGPVSQPAPPALPEPSTLPLSVAQASLANLGIMADSSITHARVASLKEEPQIVPSLGSTPPHSPACITPIDMDDQEVQKQERKRERNRMAARKCRNRKIERITTLEAKVAELKAQNHELNSTSHDLRAQVATLKKQIISHVSQGCKVMVNHNLLEC